MKEQTINIIKNVTDLFKNIHFNVNMSLNGYPAAICICGICGTGAYIYTIYEENKTKRATLNNKIENCTVN